MNPRVQGLGVKGCSGFLGLGNAGCVFSRTCDTCIPTSSGDVSIPIRAVIWVAVGGPKLQ